MRSVLMSVASVSSVVLAASAGASVVTSNLGEAHYGDNAVAGNSVDSGQSIANRFTAGAGSWSIDSVTVKIRDLSPSTPDNYQLQIRTDASGTPGSTVLGTLIMAANDVGGSFADYTYSPSLPMTLAGGSYWLVAVPTAPSALYQWTDTDSLSHTSVSGWSIDDRQWTATDTTGTAWSRDPAPIRHQFSVAATFVPEPTSLAAFALSSLVLNRRRTSL